MSDLIRRNALLALVAASFIPAALAAEEGKKEDAADPLLVELTNLVLPVARNGQLMNYMFVVVKVQALDLASATFVREQHFIVRDAITRAASRNPVVPGASARTYDAASVNRMLMAAVVQSKPGLRIARVYVFSAAFMRN